MEVGLHKHISQNSPYLPLVSPRYLPPHNLPSLELEAQTIFLCHVTSLQCIIALLWSNPSLGLYFFLYEGLHILFKHISKHFLKLME